MEKRRVYQGITTAIMIALVAYAIYFAIVENLEGMPGMVIINVSISIMAMACLAILALASTIDQMPQDKSGIMFFILVTVTFFGVILVNYSWLFLELDYGIPTSSDVFLLYALGALTYLVFTFLGPIFMTYQRFLFSERRVKGIHKLVYYAMPLDIIYIIVATASGFLFYYDDAGYYHGGSGRMITMIFPLLVCGVSLIDNLQEEMEMRKRIALLAFDLTPLFLGTLEIYMEDLSTLYFAFTLDLLLIYVVVQMERSIEMVAQAHKIAEQNRDLNEKQTQIMLSMMQPHFIYNTLGSISALCEENPLKARDVTDRFAMYMRTNMSNLKSNQLIPFKNELEHTRAYLWIEQIRFENYLQVEYDIRTMDFSLPPLSLQPIVENAVKHGVIPKLDGGTVKISTVEEADRYLIRVEDDGVGFDIEQSFDDQRLHVGIENTRVRLDILCGASLEVQSEKNLGTIVTIIIPKKEG